MRVYVSAVDDSYVRVSLRARVCTCKVCLFRLIECSFCWFASWFVRPYYELIMR